MESNLLVYHLCFSVKELEHLDWNFRIRIIMGTAYCLQYMHELNPPLPHSNLNANSILLTEDYAAKVCNMQLTDMHLHTYELSYAF